MLVYEVIQESITGRRLCTCTVLLFIPRPWPEAKTAVSKGRETDRLLNWVQVGWFQAEKKGKGKKLIETNCQRI